MRNLKFIFYKRRRIMKRKKQNLIPITVIFLAVGFTMSVYLVAQQPQIPTLQVCNKTLVKGKATVEILKRKDATHSGTFTLFINPEKPLSCDPGDSGYPGGEIVIHDINMSDSSVNGDIYVTLIEQVTTTGKHTPTVYLNGRCKIKSEGTEFKGCRFWMMIADNKGPREKGTPDIIGFLVFDREGRRIAYGTGPVKEGDIDVADTSF
jgi:hypothetical protein